MEGPGRGSGLPFPPVDESGPPGLVSDSDSYSRSLRWRSRSPSLISNASSDEGLTSLREALLRGADSGSNQLDNSQTGSLQQQPQQPHQQRGRSGSTRIGASTSIGGNVHIGGLDEIDRSDSEEGDSPGPVDLFEGLFDPLGQFTAMEDDFDLRAMGDNSTLGATLPQQLERVVQGMGLNDNLLQQVPVQDLLGMVMRNSGGLLAGGADVGAPGVVAWPIEEMMTGPFGRGMAGPGIPAGLVGAERRHAVFMAEQGFATAVNPARHAACAAEGVPGGRRQASPRAPAFSDPASTSGPAGYSATRAAPRQPQANRAATVPPLSGRTLQRADSASGGGGLRRGDSAASQGDGAGRSGAMQLDAAAPAASQRQRSRFGAARGAGSSGHSSDNMPGLILDHSGIRSDGGVRAGVRGGTRSAGVGQRNGNAGQPSQRGSTHEGASSPSGPQQQHNQSGLAQPQQQQQQQQQQDLSVAQELDQESPRRRRPRRNAVFGQLPGLGLGSAASVAVAAVSTPAAAAVTASHSSSSVPRLELVETSDGSGSDGGDDPPPPLARPFSFSEGADLEEVQGSGVRRGAQRAAAAARHRRRRRGTPAQGDLNAEAPPLAPPSSSGRYDEDRPPGLTGASSESGSPLPGMPGLVHVRSSGSLDLLDTPPSLSQSNVGSDSSGNDAVPPPLANSSEGSEADGQGESGRQRFYGFDPPGHRTVTLAAVRPQPGWIPRAAAAAPAAAQQPTGFTTDQFTVMQALSGLLPQQGDAAGWSELAAYVRHNSAGSGAGGSGGAVQLLSRLVAAAADRYPAEAEAAGLTERPLAPLRPLPAAIAAEAATVSPLSAAAADGSRHASEPRRQQQSQQQGSQEVEEPGQEPQVTFVVGSPRTAARLQQQLGPGVAVAAEGQPPLPQRLPQITLVVGSAQAAAELQRHQPGPGFTVAAEQPFLAELAAQASGELAGDAEIAGSNAAGPSTFAAAATAAPAQRAVAARPADLAALLRLRVQEDVQASVARTEATLRALSGVVSHQPLPPLVAAAVAAAAGPPPDQAEE